MRGIRAQFKSVFFSLPNFFEGETLINYLTCRIGFIPNALEALAFSFYCQKQ